MTSLLKSNRVEFASKHPMLFIRLLTKSGFDTCRFNLEGKNESKLMSGYNENDKFPRYSTLGAKC